MIIADSKTDVQTSGIGETSRATIKASARLFNFFSDMIYSDKFVAIWRELVANGMDAQTAAGNPQQQMIVTLPTDFTPYAKVRDFGTGMSHEFLMGKFMAYTDASTKENSNDFIGGFGIGSKAPLSYTEQFAIHSYQNGEVGIYSIFKDDTGCPSIAFLGRHPSPEPDGIEISFPVEGKDIKAFREAATKTLTYFQPLPVLVNSEQQLFAPEYTVRTPTWGFLTGANNSRIVQGGIAYPIDKGSCPDIDDVLEFGIDFFVPIGSCSIALSRERLSYDERTIRILKSLALAIRPELEKHVASMFENCKTKWEANALFNRETKNTGNAVRQRLVRAHASYKGQRLTGRFAPCFTNKVHIALVTSERYHKSNYGMWTESKMNPTVRAWMNDLFPDDISVILIDDKPNKPVLRTRRYLEENDISRQGVAILRVRPEATMSKMEWGRLLVKLGRPPVIKLSEIEPAVVTNISYGTRVEKIRAYKSADFSSPRPKAKFIDTVPATGGYYMIMDRFTTVDGQANMQQLRASGLQPDDILWFNKGDFDKVKSNPKLKPAIDKFNETMEKYKQTYRNLGLASAFASVAKDRYGTRSERNMLWIDLIGLPGFNIPKRGPLFQLMKAYALIQDQLTDAHASMRSQLNVTCVDEAQQIAALFSAARTTHPDLWKLVKKDAYLDASLLTVYNKLI
jgi:hypothetical protein